MLQITKAFPAIFFSPAKMIWNSIPAKGFHSLMQSDECRHGAGSRNPVNVGLTFVSDGIALAPSLGKQGGAPVACK
jgi:hypothetical protein